MMVGCGAQGSFRPGLASLRPANRVLAGDRPSSQFVGTAAAFQAPSRLSARRQSPLIATAAAGTGPFSTFSYDTEVGDENSKEKLESEQQKAQRAFRRVGALIAVALDAPTFRLFVQAAQFLASVLFVGLYVIDTYYPPIRGSPRYFLELALCTVFAGEYAYRLCTQHPDTGSKLRMVTSGSNIIDLLSFLPPLLEAAMQQFLPGVAFGFGRVDLRWIKLLRSMRVMRVGLLGAELRSLHLSTKRGGWLSAGANFRLAQLATSVFMLLFIASAIIQVVEQMPFHKAVYLVATTLSTVGYGDVVATSMLGRAAIMGMIALGIVLIPVQAAAFYTEVNARRVMRGTLPDWRGKPFVLLSSRLTEVRAFSDLFAEFQQTLASSSSARFPRSTKLLVLCNRPSFEFSAFQELHDREMTLVEGSAVSGQDLVTVRAERANAVLLLADRFTTDPESEDLSVLFQVWACKGYTKTVPLFVQTLREKTVRQVAPFLDPGQDVVFSAEQTRYRLLALSAVTPGASTLIGNLMRSSAVLPPDVQGETLAGRRWLRQFVNGCAFSFCTAPMQRHLAGRKFMEVAEWLYRSAGFVLMGVIDPGKKVRLNPAQEELRMGTQLLVVGPDKRVVRRALAEEFMPRPHPLGSREGGGGGGGSGTESEELAQEQPDMCFPVVWGNYESESLDADAVPCVPADVANAIQSEADARLFMQRFAEDAQAQEEQEELGKLGLQTARVLAQAAGFNKQPQGEENGAGSSGMVEQAKEEQQAEETQPQQVETLQQQQEAERQRSALREAPFSGHFIVCGHIGSLIPFLAYLRAAEPSESVRIVVLSLKPPRDLQEAQRRFGPVSHVTGSPAEAASLRAAGAATAKALVYLARGSRPVKTAQGTGAAVEQERSTREAVLADAAALLACYGVGEESGSSLTHAVVELLFTTSIEFLQPGLLLRGVSSLYDDTSTPGGAPRKSWTMRAWQQREAVAEGLAEWQANPYYAAGRVTVPALMDTFATQCFFGKGLLVEVLAEMSGDLGRESSSDVGGKGGEEKPTSGALLRLMPLPKRFVGRSYGELFAAWAVGKCEVCLGLYRSKTENPLTRLSYVVANPPATERLEASDRVFVLRERPR